MEALLLYNPVAGGGQRSGEVFCKLLEAYGYRCEAYPTDDLRWRRRASPDRMVVVAGGDGTIKEVARHLVGTDIPLALLPIGTSNNIALSLRAFGSPTSLMSRWRTWRPQAIDVVSVTLGESHCYAFEGCGFGLFGRWIHLGPYTPDRIPRDTRKQIVREDRRFLWGVAESVTADECTLHIEGETISGQFLLIEAANIGLLGARVPIAPTADPTDGLLDVVIGHADQRAPIVDWLRRVAEGEDAGAPPLPVRRAQSLRIEFARGGYHIDDDAALADQPPEGKTRHSLEVNVLPGALQILQPQAEA